MYADRSEGYMLIGVRVYADRNEGHMPIGVRGVFCCSIDVGYGMPC